MNDLSTNAAPLAMNHWTTKEVESSTTTTTSKYGSKQSQSHNNNNNNNNNNKLWNESCTTLDTHLMTWDESYQTLVHDDDNDENVATHEPLNAIQFFQRSNEDGDFDESLKGTLETKILYRNTATQSHNSEEKATQDDDDDDDGDEIIMGSILPHLGNLSIRPATSNNDIIENQNNDEINTNSRVAADDGNDSLCSSIDQDDLPSLTQVTIVNLAKIGVYIPRGYDDDEDGNTDDTDSLCITVDSLVVTKQRLEKQDQSTCCR
eukprot:CAMPEP_0116851732 /NCGR_PEP_ID=MMETSP0418-20121206/16894_1 /TAXON_ID=1158023 /ORGANISM="Astrosyne radiata, Strain 13vi08-1A" /LENGTH=262 /DNA_ID=CAMNT_0004483803 /DNA_START=15 /DNA_END=803 /DNA_ORIENTATION=+